MKDHDQQEGTVCDICRLSQEPVGIVLWLSCVKVLLSNGEMIHHKQNLEGKIQNIQGQNINEDDYLKELEAEAYLQGNGLLFRGWENNLKND